jgi:hypothetical protein
MEPIKAGVEKVKEKVEGNKAHTKVEKAKDPSVKPGERVDAAVDAGKAKVKEHEHGVKSDYHKNKNSAH